MWWAWKGIQYSLCVGGLAKIPHSLIMGLISKYPMCYMWGELKRIHSAITRGGLERDPPNPKCEWLIKRSPHVLRVGAMNGDSLPFTCGGGVEKIPCPLPVRVWKKILHPLHPYM